LRFLIGFTGKFSPLNKMSHAYWKRGFQASTAVEPLKHMIPSDHVRLSSFQAPLNAASLGRNRRSEYDPSSAVDAYKKLSNDYISSIKSKKNPFAQTAMSSMENKNSNSYGGSDNISRTLTMDDRRMNVSNPPPPPIPPQPSPPQQQQQQFMSQQQNKNIEDDALTNAVRETMMSGKTYQSAPDNQPHDQLKQQQQQQQQQQMQQVQQKKQHQLQQPQSQPQPQPQSQSQSQSQSQPSNEYEELKKKIIKQLLNEGANEQMIYEALSRLEAARKRKLQRDSNSRTRIHELQEKQQFQQRQQRQQPQQPQTLYQHYPSSTTPLSLSQLAKQSFSESATVDVFGLSNYAPSSPRDRYKTKRHYKNINERMTGLIGPTETIVSQKRHISPRSFEPGTRSFVGDRKSQVIQYRSSRKRPIENQETRLLQAKNWVDTSDYPSELPIKRLPRKKESPRANTIFGQKRVLLEDKKFDRFDLNKPVISGNKNFNGPQKLNLKNSEDHYRRNFIEKQKSYSKSMDQWNTTKAVSTLMLKPVESVESIAVPPLSSIKLPDNW
jgi:hypothetical protein